MIHILIGVDTWGEFSPRIYSNYGRKYQCITIPWYALPD
nr:MAG TPA: hypothetical protein [Caudoviricetes sp.]